MKKLTKAVVAVFALGVMAGSVNYVRAQEPVRPEGCDFKTRWKDAKGVCTGCCDARVYSCPCTV